jgi:hypothetical protein
VKLRRKKKGERRKKDERRKNKDERKKQDEKELKMIFIQPLPITGNRQPATGNQ